MEGGTAWIRAFICWILLDVSFDNVTFSRNINRDKSTFHILKIRKLGKGMNNLVKDKGEFW